MRSTHFNPRSREGSDDCVKQYDRHESISNHAPAKGATVTPADGWVKGLISIHAPAKGATFQTLKNSLVTLDFNPRSREGSDADFLDKFAEGLISIHAPAKGATLSRSRTCDAGKISIHAPAKGATDRKPLLS